MSSQSGNAQDALARFLVALPSGKVIFEEGTAGSEMFIIEDGQVEIFRRIGPIERRLAVLEAGDFFGEMALLDEEPRTAAARALSDCRLLPVDATTFDQMLRQNPEIAVRMMRNLSQRLREHERAQATADRIAFQPLEVPAPQAPAPETQPAAESAPATTRGVVLVHGLTGQRFPLKVEGDVTLGRRDPVSGFVPDVDLGELDTQRSLSRRHAKIRRTGNDLTIREEIGTANGTFVNGLRLETGVPRPLVEGDEIRLGLVALALSFE